MIKKEIHFFLMILVLMIIIPLASGRFFDEVYDKITGKATQTVGVNVTVGGPEIRNVYNTTASIIAAATGLSAGPLNTSIIINFSVYLGTGVANINNASATINFSKAGEALRQNASCNQFEVGTNIANYTCNVTMSWYDGSGSWAIQAFINDTNGNSGKNNSANFSVGETTGFEMGTLGWSSLAPGTTNKTSTAALRLNNTGNKNMSVNTTQVNATNLRGETTSTLALWSGNISVSWDATALKACDTSGGNETRANNLTAGNYINVTMANLTKGNYFSNDGNTGQEDFYFCIKIVGSDLTSQQYSTANEGVWTIRILLTPFFYIVYRRSKKKNHLENQGLLNIISYKNRISHE